MSGLAAVVKNDFTARTDPTPDLGKWLVGLSGLVAPLAAGFSVGGTTGLVGDASNRLFDIAIVVTGLSFACAVIAVAIPGPGRILMIASGALFSIALIMATTAAITSREQDLDNRRVAGGRPLLTYSSNSDNLSVSLGLTRVSRAEPVGLRLEAIPERNAPTLPFQETVSDLRGIADVSVEVPRLKRYAGRTIFALAHWGDRVSNGRLAQLSCYQRILRVPGRLKGKARRRERSGPASEVFGVPTTCDQGSTRT